MTFSLVTTHHFERRARKFLRKHPNLKSVFAETLEKLQNDPFQPSLKLHGLGGILSNIQAVSLTHSYRLTLTVQITEREIVFLRYWFTPAHYIKSTNVERTMRYVE